MDIEGSLSSNHSRSIDVPDCQFIATEEETEGRASINLFPEDLTKICEELNSRISGTVFEFPLDLDNDVNASPENAEGGD